MDEADLSYLFGYVKLHLRLLSTLRDNGNRVASHRRSQGGGMTPQSILDKNKDFGRAGATGVWSPNQKAYSFENSGFCAYFQTLASPDERLAL